MKTEKKLGKILYFILVLIICGLLVKSPGFSAETKKVAVLPFMMNTQEDLTFLQKGIFDMFLSRLSYGDEVEVLTRENLETALGTTDSPFSITQGINEAQAKQMGDFLKVDYVLFGSLTLFGNSMSLDVKMVDIKNNQPSLTFFKQGNEAGAVIPELNTIAEEINYKVFGRETLEAKSQQALQNAYEGGGGESSASPLKQSLTLLTVDGALNGVATGDLNGDKENEIVVIHDKSVQIFKYGQNRKINLVQRFEDDPSFTSLVGVDVADINQNGFAEIFITKINSRQSSVDSYVIEYDGSKYVKGKTTYPWYLRVVKDARGNSKLFAQEHTKKGPWDSPNVFSVSWTNNDYTPEIPLRVPGKTIGFSVMSMTTAVNVLKDADIRYLFTDKIGRLTIFNELGKIDWSSEQGYGGSYLNYTFPKTHHGTQDFKYAFLQPKNLVYDLDADGKIELFVIKNKESSNYLFENTRVFKKGSVEILTLGDMGLSSDNLPKTFPGPVSSIEIGDYDNDSKMELLVTMIKKKGLFTKSSSSLLVVYDLE